MKVTKKLISAIAMISMLLMVGVATNASAASTTHNSNADFSVGSNGSWSGNKWDNNWYAEIYNSEDETFDAANYSYDGGYAADGWTWNQPIVKGDNLKLGYERTDIHPVRTFVVRQTGTLTIDESIIRHGNRNGLILKILKNNETIWFKELNWSGNTTTQPVQTIQVTNGDKIRFVVIQTVSFNWGLDVSWTNNLTVMQTESKVYNSNANYTVGENGSWHRNTWDDIWYAEVYNSETETYSDTQYIYSGGYAPDGWTWNQPIIKGDSLAVGHGNLTTHPVRTFVVPETGSLVIDAANMSNNRGGSLEFNIKKNDEIIWTATATWWGQTINQPKKTLQVQKGDVIRFEVIHKQDIGYGGDDATILWTNNLTLITPIPDKYIDSTSYSFKDGQIEYSYKRGTLSSNADIYVAVYDSTDSLVYVALNSESGSYNGDVSEEYTTMLYVWDKVEKMKPLCNAIELK